MCKAMNCKCITSYDVGVAGIQRIFPILKKMIKDGAIFQTTSDTETIVQLIARSKRLKTIDKIIDSLFDTSFFSFIANCSFSSLFVLSI